MTGYSPHLSALGQLDALRLVERHVAKYPRRAPELVAMQRDRLIAELLPPADGVMRHADHAPEVICRPAFGNGLCEPLKRRRAAVRPYRGETPWV